MATYIILSNFTDQGIRNVKDTAKRAEMFKEMAKKKDVSVKDLFWTLGAYDVVAIVDAPNDEAITGVGLTLGMQGNVRTQTLRAYNASEIGKILGKVGYGGTVSRELAMRSSHLPLVGRGRALFLACSTAPHPVLRTTLSPPWRGEGRNEALLE
jgi:uncharacterized protein with GYD domain